MARDGHGSADTLKGAWVIRHDASLWLWRLYPHAQFAWSSSKAWFLLWPALILEYQELWTVLSKLRMAKLWEFWVDVLTSSRWGWPLYMKGAERSLQGWRLAPDAHHLPQRGRYVVMTDLRALHQAVTKHFWCGIGRWNKMLKFMVLRLVSQVKHKFFKEYRPKRDHTTEDWCGWSSLHSGLAVATLWPSSGGSELRWSRSPVGDFWSH